MPLGQARMHGTMVLTNMHGPDRNHIAIQGCLRTGGGGDRRGKLYLFPKTWLCKIAQQNACITVRASFRMLRYADSSITTVSVFCFPKCGEDQCIIEIKLRWENFYLFTYLKRFHEIQTGLDRLTSVIVQQFYNPALRPPDDNLMTLSSTDLPASYF